VCANLGPPAWLSILHQSSWIERQNLFYPRFNIKRFVLREAFLSFFSLLFCFSLPCKHKKDVFHPCFHLFHQGEINIEQYDHKYKIGTIHRDYWQFSFRFLFFFATSFIIRLLLVSPLLVSHLLPPLVLLVPILPRPRYDIKSVCFLQYTCINRFTIV
jgi:hypothetical protein